MNLKPTPVKELSLSGNKIVLESGFEVTLKVPTAEDLLEMELKFPNISEPVRLSKVAKGDYLEIIGVPHMLKFAETFMQQPPDFIKSRMRNMLGSMTITAPNTPPVVLLYSDYDEALLCTVCAQITPHKLVK